jgi:hypothetical protein
VYVYVHLPFFEFWLWYPFNERWEDYDKILKIYYLLQKKHLCLLHLLHFNKKLSLTYNITSVCKYHLLFISILYFAFLIVVYLASSSSSGIQYCDKLLSWSIKNFCCCSLHCLCLFLCECMLYYLFISIPSTSLSHYWLHVFCLHQVI